MISSLHNYLNVFRATQVSLAGQSNNNAVSSTTVPMVQRAPVCPTCKGDCGDYSDAINHYPRYDVIDERCLVVAPMELRFNKAKGKDREFRLKPEVLANFQRMHDAAKKDGVDLLIFTAFRNRKDQEMMIQRKKEKKEEALVAPVDHTEHHTGCTIDIKNCQEGSKVYNWLMKHGKEYGFELSYPRKKPQLVTYESWHWRFNEDLLPQKK